MRHRQSTCCAIVALVATGMLVARAAPAAPRFGFGPESHYAAGSLPYFFDVADLNGDGYTDVVVPNAGGGANSISVLLNDGAGHLLARTSFPAGPNPDNLAIGDLNADGFADVALVNDRYPNPDLMSVMLGHGDGTFGPPSSYDVGRRAASLAIGDVNGDGHPDIAVSNTGPVASENTVSVFLGYGNGTFAPRLDTVTEYGPWWVELGDMNGDGRLDIVTTHHYFGIVAIQLGNGDGTFGPFTGYPVYAQSWKFQLADLDGDGRLDVVTSARTPGNIVCVLMGNGDGTLAPRVDYTVPDGSWPVAVADYDGDGRLDIGVAGDGVFSVLPGHGNGTFDPAYVPFPSGVNPVDVRSADLDRDGRPDLVADDPGAATVGVMLNTSGTTIAPQPPPTCLTPATPCVEVPVTIDRADAASLRAFSVQVQLSANLALCGAGIAEGTYLAGIGGTQFLVTDNGGGSYTVDCAILGLPCGATAPAGTLFTLHVSSAAATGTGSVAVTPLKLRTCDNAPVLAYGGPPAIVPIDNAVPGAITLSGAQRRTGNVGGSVTAIDLAWTGTLEPGDSVLVYRAPWGSYPEYDDVGGGVPAVPAYPPGVPWELAATVVGAASCADAPPVRDFWYHVAFVKDPCGNVGPVSNRVGGHLDYHLGDVSDGVTECLGDNSVGTADVSLLGAHYGITLVPADPYACLDVGPTTDYSVNARPTTDNRVDFEDLVMFAMNYSQVSMTALASRVAAAAERDEVAIESPETVVAGDSFAVTLRLRGAGDVQALSATLDWDRAVAEPLGVEAGELIVSQRGLVLSSKPGNVDAAVLGNGRTISGDGVLATVTFRALAAGDPRVTIATLDARDVANRRVSLLGAPLAAPATTQLAAAKPNPFRGTTTIAWSLAKDGPADLAIYGVDGRRVTTLAKGVAAAGTHQVTWEGRGAAGRLVRPGLYYARLVTAEGRFTRALVLIR